MANYTDTFSARSAVAIDYSGGNQSLSGPCRAIYIATAGNLVVRLSGDTANRTFTGLLAGNIYPLSVVTIVQASSTATGLALF